VKKAPMVNRPPPSAEELTESNGAKLIGRVFYMDVAYVQAVKTHNVGHVEADLSARFQQFFVSLRKA
jgi:hypothetical protein